MSCPTLPQTFGSARELVRSILRDDDAREVSEIVERMVDLTDPATRAAWFEELAPDFVRRMLHEHARPPRSLRPAEDAPETPQGGANGAAMSERKPPPPAGRVKQTHVPSAKVAAIREHWWRQKLARTNLSVGDRRKILAEFTVDDALAVAENLRKIADDTAAEAARYEALAKAMKDAGVAVAADLDAKAGYAIWHGQAAAA